MGRMKDLQIDLMNEEREKAFEEKTLTWEEIEGEPYNGAL